ncbi:MAG: hypothetical protein Q7T73_03405 [Beijerinckiaceae bacterium]|nr:hypothetical protein [Beijerinckiaceae bacterium]
MVLLVLALAVALVVLSFGVSLVVRGTPMKTAEGAGLLVVVAVLTAAVLLSV